MSPSSLTTLWISNVRLENLIDMDTEAWFLGRPRPVCLVAQRLGGERLLVVDRADQVAGEAFALDVGGGQGDVGHGGGGDFALEVRADGAGEAGGLGELGDGLG